MHRTTSESAAKGRERGGRTGRLLFYGAKWTYEEARWEVEQIP
jgi:hypothetical protein